MTAEDERLARKAAAFDALLDNIATVRKPQGGDPKTIEFLLNVLAEQPPVPESEPESEPDD